MEKFYFFNSFLDTARAIEDEKTRLEYMMAVAEYWIEGKESDNPIIKALMVQTKFVLDRSKEMSEQKSEKMKWNQNAVKNWWKQWKQTKTEKNREKQKKQEEEVEGEEEYKEIWDNKLSHKESFDELYDNFYWINKWADRTKCDKLIKNLLSNWVSVDELLSDELLYKAECQIKWERRYVKKFETWLREYNQQTAEQREQTIKQVLVMYYNKKKEDDKFEQSARNPRNMLCERFWEKNIAKMYFEVKPKKTINLVFN